MRTTLPRLLTTLPRLLAVLFRFASLRRLAQGSALLAQGSALAAFVAFVALWPPDAAAQTLWTRPFQPSQVAVEVLSPRFDNDDVTLATGAAYLTATYSLNENVELVGEMPLAHYAADTDSGRVSASAIGNPYLGVGLSSASFPLLVELGLRLPATPGNLASLAGSTTDPGRTRAFTEDETLLSAFVNYRVPFGRRTSLRLRPGLVFAEFPSVNPDTGSPRTEQDLRLNYHVQLWREGETMLVGLAFTGRAVLTAPGSFGTKSRHHFVATTLLDFDAVQPGLVVGVSFDEVVRDTSPYFVGLTLSTSLLR